MSRVTLAVPNAKGTSAVTFDVKGVGEAEAGRIVHDAVGLGVLGAELDVLDRRVDQVGVELAQRLVVDRLRRLAAVHSEHDVAAQPVVEGGRRVLRPPDRVVGQRGAGVTRGGDVYAAIEARGEIARVDVIFDGTAGNGGSS